jgi:hypothetical protein
VSLIIKKEERNSSLNFPIRSEFFLVTDDGFEFVGLTSGSDGKNFSSRGNNKVFGRWAKGKLEEAGVLARNEPVTAEVLSRYGKQTMTLQMTDEVKFDAKSGKNLPVYLISF